MSENFRSVGQPKKEQILVLLDWIEENEDKCFLFYKDRDRTDIRQSVLVVRRDLSDVTPFQLFSDEEFPDYYALGWMCPRFYFPKTAPI